MEQINSITLRGLVGNVRRSNVGEKEVANFSLATSYAYKGWDGQAVIDTTWLNVVAWRGKGIQDLERIAKGSPVQVTGRLRQHKFTGTDGQERQVYEVLANKLEVIDTDETLQPAQ